MSNNKISSHPPKQKSMEDFILEAETRKSISDLKKENKIVVPWKQSHIRDDVQKAFTVKLPEEYLLKLQFLSTYTNKSQQKIIREFICTNLDKLLDDLNLPKE